LGGAVQLIAAAVEEEVGAAVTAVGAIGVVAGVAAGEAVDDTPVPAALVAVTVKV
jgi:hypothetical protein